MKARHKNTSYAVMARRIEGRDSLDDFPTPPWATRALIEYVISNSDQLKMMSCLEPACGRGHMAKVLHEYFSHVEAYDVHGYGYGDIYDFLSNNYKMNSYDWVITNPPFRLGEEFILRALKFARVGVAMLTRTVFIEGVGRHSRIFRDSPPTKFAQFAERVPMLKGRLDQKASTATGYGWLVWEKGADSPTQLVWIPPCRKNLERDGDYEVPIAQLPFSIVEGRGGAVEAVSHRAEYKDQTEGQNHRKTPREHAKGNVPRRS